MSWYNLSEEQKDAMISLCLLMVIVLAAVSFYLQNPIWQIVNITTILLFGIYGFYLYQTTRHEYIKIKAEAPLRKRIAELERDLEKGIKGLKK